MMKRFVAAAIAALLAVVPNVAMAQGRTFAFAADALDTATDGRRYGLKAAGLFTTDDGVTSGGLTTYQLTGVGKGTVTFYNDYNPGDPLTVAAIDELAFAPPFFTPPQYVVFDAGGMLTSADFTFGLSDFPYVAGFRTSDQTVSFGLEGVQRLNSLQVNAVAAAVPEPASWALMIVGFGAVGATMRRRKVRLALA